MILSLCLEMIFRDRPFVTRLEEAAKCGYRAIEFWDWRDKEIDHIAVEAERLGLTIAAISGNRKHALIDPQARAGLLEEMEQVFRIAGRLRCRHIMMLTDVLQPDGSAAPVPDLSDEAKRRSVVDGLRALAHQTEGRDVILLLEPLNTVLDHRLCFLSNSDDAAALVEMVGHARVRLLYDVYHMSMMGEDARAEIEKKAQWIGYLHAADMPGRHEPGSAAIPWRGIVDQLRTQRYSGFVGMEFAPRDSDETAARRAIEIFS